MRKLFKDFLELSRERGVNFETLDIAKEVMIRESTIRVGDGRGFSDQEMILLAKELLACRIPTLARKEDPHFEIPTRDFEKDFKERFNSK